MPARRQLEFPIRSDASLLQRQLEFPTSILPLGGWEAIFKDAMTTAAAIDRLVHHSVILELNVPSYRAEAAKKNKQARTAGPGGDPAPAQSG